MSKYKPSYSKTTNGFRTDYYKVGNITSAIFHKTSPI